MASRGATRANRALAVAVIQGGPSTEAEVSRASAAGVARALVDAGHAVERLELEPRLGERLRTGGFDVAFPVAHGAVGEDGSLQGLLEVLGLPYVGSGVLASALAMHKRVARGVFDRAGLPVARGVTLARPATGREATTDCAHERVIAAAALAGAERVRREVGARVVVKPSSHGSAIGVARLETEAPMAEVARAIEAVWAIDDHAVVEHFARGREVTCGVLERAGLAGPGSDAAVALPPTEILAPRDAFYTYEARYAPGRSDHVCPADLRPALTRAVQALALAAHEALGCRDLSRVDFIVGDITGDVSGDGSARDTLTLLEVNTLPGMTATSLYPEAAAVAGLSMTELCSGLALRAHARGPTHRNAARPLPT